MWLSYESHSIYLLHHFVKDWVLPIDCHKFFTRVSSRLFFSSTSALFRSSPFSFVAEPSLYYFLPPLIIHTAYATCPYHAKLLASTILDSFFFLNKPYNSSCYICNASVILSSIKVPQSRSYFTFPIRFPLCQLQSSLILICIHFDELTLICLLHNRYFNTSGLILF